MEHQDESSGGSGGMIAGIILGALIGAGIALLAAPRTGEDTRRHLSKRARTLRDDAVDRFDEASRRARRELSRRRRRLRSQIEDGVEAARERFTEDS